MSKVKCGLIVSDFDGTLLSTKQTISDNVKNAINEYVAAGGIFAVCTGRMLASILPRVRSLGLKGLVAAYQGTVIADIESGRLIRSGGFTVDEGVEICRVLEDHGEAINTYADDAMYTSLAGDDKLLSVYENVTGIEGVRVNGKMSEFVKEHSLSCQKIVSVVMPDKKRALYDYLVEKFGERFEVTYSAAVLVELSPKGDDKGAALKYIADYYKIPLENTVAVGDNLNDLPMIEAAGTGVAVANALEELKTYADGVCPSCDDDGIAFVIRKYGLA